MTGNVELYQLEWYQPSEQPQSVLHQRGVDEAVLSLERLNRAAAWIVYHRRELALTPDQPDLHLRLGEVFLRAGNWRRASEDRC